MIAGNIILIEGISEKGKEEVVRFGSEWTVLLLSQKVEFSKEVSDWIMISPNLKSCRFRWIKQEQDPNFRIVAVRT